MIPFAGSPLMRASERRTDAGWINARRADPASLVLPLWRLQPFLFHPTKPSLQAQLGLFSPATIQSIANGDAPWVFLGLKGEAAVFTVDVSATNDPGNRPPLAGAGNFYDARTAAQMVSLEDAAIIGQAKALIDWHRRHGFCPACGAPTDMVDAGYRRLCGQCHAEHFPRVDPVVIMLVSHEGACLVGRGKQFPPKMFSTLAGFIEPGETIEEAVRRELMEEASVRVSEVTYFASQPWPFPSSLMIGCFAKAETRAVKIDETELAELRWLERAMARELLGGKEINGMTLPPPIAIAHHLIKAWAYEEMPR
jgi:NAD+ diphosphatase